MAANRLGVQRMQALCAKYSTDMVLAVGDALQSYAERKMRAGIAALPDGTYRFADTYDNPELGRALPVSVEVTIAGDEMRLHFESPPQVRAGINMIYTALLSSVYYAVKAVVDPTILPNSGLSRPLTVTAPPGTIFNAVHPAAVNGRTSTSQRAADLVIGALAQAAPERVTAAGNGACATASFSGAGADGHLWVYLETIGGGSGARPNKDGLDGVHVHMTNTSNLPVEALELEYPLTVLRYELVDGSGGAGKFRGGMGLRRVYRAEAGCQLRVDGSRLFSEPWGLAGGEAGGRAAYSFSDGVTLTGGGRGVLHPGDTVEIVTPGAGGYGPPSERDPAAVVTDIADGRVG
jgi:N-methylhydantoinase B